MDYLVVIKAFPAGGVANSVVPVQLIYSLFYQPRDRSPAVLHFRKLQDRLKSLRAFGVRSISAALFDQQTLYKT